MEKYDVFISFKNTDQDGNRTKDADMAEELYYALQKRGIRAFYSNISITQSGISAFAKEIQKALNTSSVFVVVATSVENLTSEWVEMEIQYFHRRIAKNNKKKFGHLEIYPYFTPNVNTDDDDYPIQLINHQIYTSLSEVERAVYTSLSEKSLGMKVPLPPKDKKENLVLNTAVLRDVAVLEKEERREISPIQIPQPTPMPQPQQSMKKNLIGEVIDGKYKILKEIGRGSTGVVYLAKNERAEKLWAVKVLNRDNSSLAYDVIRQSLLTEINMIRRLFHPYIVSVVDVIDTPTSFMVVMDYVQGVSLKAVIDEYGEQPQDIVIEWAKQLCNVFSYLHSQTPPIIHRDLKPGNLMLQPDGSLKLIDFGIAREYKEGQQEDTTSLGTAGYAAPEQFGGKGQTDARTDIYGLGVTLHHCLTGHSPSEPPYEMKPIREYNPELSYGMEYIIKKCIEPDPAKRYQTMKEILYDLENMDKTKRKARWEELKSLNFGFLLSLSKHHSKVTDQGVHEDAVVKQSRIPSAVLIASVSHLNRGDNEQIEFHLVSSDTQDALKKVLLKKAEHDNINTSKRFHLEEGEEILVELSSQSLLFDKHSFTLSREKNMVAVKVGTFADTTEESNCSIIAKIQHREEYIGEVELKFQ